MSDKAYYRDAVPQDHDETYDLLRGPNGFGCLLTDPEDRTWGRDGKPVIAELNRLHSLLVKACTEIALDVWARVDGGDYGRRAAIDYVRREYGVTLRWNKGTFEEDTTK